TPTPAATLLPTTTVSLTSTTAIATTTITTAATTTTTTTTVSGTAATTQSAPTATTKREFATNGSSIWNVKAFTNSNWANITWSHNFSAGTDFVVEYITSNNTVRSIPVKAQTPSSVQLADLTPGMTYQLWVFPKWSSPSKTSYITFTTSSGCCLFICIQIEIAHLHRGCSILHSDFSADVIELLVNQNSAFQF
ncbi:unnamed protein product, partial [Lepidochelys kempii]